jgi:flagellar L-ring protein precursor FlgH
MKMEEQMRRFDGMKGPIARDGFCAHMAVAIVLAVAMSACATTPPPRQVVDVEAEKQVYKSGSLWPGANKKNIMFADNKASKVGDIVTVHVIENTTAINRADTSDQSATDNSLLVDTGSLTPTQIKLGGGRKSAGKGTTGRSDQFSSTVSCIVMEVLPNGNMVVEGQRRMGINKEQQFIFVHGTVRPSDITFNNSVLSSKMADLDIVYNGGGGIDGGKSPGWLAQVLGAVWPF